MAPHSTVFAKLTPGPGTARPRRRRGRRSRHRLGRPGHAAAGGETLCAALRLAGYHIEEPGRLREVSKAHPPQCRARDRDRAARRQLGGGDLARHHPRRACRVLLRLAGEGVGTPATGRMRGAGEVALRLHTAALRSAPTSAPEPPLPASTIAVKIARRCAASYGLGTLSHAKSAGERRALERKKNSSGQDCDWRRTGPRPNAGAFLWDRSYLRYRLVAGTLAGDPPNDDRDQYLERQRRDLPCSTCIHRGRAGQDPATTWPRPM